MTIETPIKFIKNRIEPFLYQIQFVFLGNVRQKKDVLLWLPKTEKMDITGMLVLYKFMDYVIIHDSFSSPRIEIRSTYIEQCLERFKFKDFFVALINDYDKNVDNKKYRKLKLGGDADFIIAPQALLRDEEQTRDKIATQYMPDIERYYNFDHKVVEMIFGCFSEMLLNFWEHAVADKRSIIVAEGDKQGVNIVCADTGDGIISTLSALPKFVKKPQSKILESAFCKNVTSKEGDPYHMGCGLWVIDETVSRSGGEIFVFTEGWCYHNKAGQKNVSKVGYWKGTIISLFLPTKTPITMSDLLPTDNFLFAN